MHRHDRVVFDEMNGWLCLEFPYVGGIQPIVLDRIRIECGVCGFQRSRDLDIRHVFAVSDHDAGIFASVLMQLDGVVVKLILAAEHIENRPFRTAKRRTDSTDLVLERLDRIHIGRRRVEWIGFVKIVVDICNVGQQFVDRLCGRPCDIRLEHREVCEGVGHMLRIHSHNAVHGLRYFVNTEQLQFGGVVRFGFDKTVDRDFREHLACDGIGQRQFKHAVAFFRHDTRQSVREETDNGVVLHQDGDQKTSPRCCGIGLGVV